MISFAHIHDKQQSAFPKEESLISQSLRGYVCFFVLFIVVHLFALAGVAQVDQGRMAGTVKDSTGAVIPGVSITITNEKTGEERPALTSDRGDYLVAGLKPSTYTVRASLDGFAPTEAKAV